MRSARNVIALVERLYRRVVIGELTNSFFDDAPHTVLVVPALRALLLQADKRVEPILDLLTRHAHRRLKRGFKRSEGPFSLSFVKPL